MHGTPEGTPEHQAESDSSTVTAYTYEPAAEIAPLLSTAAVWLDPPHELRDDVIDSVRAQLS